MNSGIYAIQNTTTSQVYVGSTVNFNQRWKQHFNALQRGDHPNRYLQSSWTKHDNEAFKFYVLERVPAEKELLEKKEALWIAATKSAEKPFGYNLIDFTTRRGGLKGYKHTSEAIEKISAAAKRQPRRQGSDAYRAKLTDFQVNQIRTLYKAGLGSQKQLGTYFGITKQAVQCILTGKSWNHLPYEEVDVSNVVLPEQKVLRGSELGNSKLTEATVVDIRRLKESGMKQRTIAATYGVSESQISAIVHSKIWTHV